MASAHRLIADEDYQEVRPGRDALANYRPATMPRFIGDSRKVERIPTGLGPDLVIETSLPPVKGLLKALLRLHELKELPAGWDSYSALPVNRDAFRPALELLTMALHRCLEPRITATSGGGLMLIWDGDDRELEIEVEPNGTFGIYYCDEATGQELDPGPGRPLGEAKHALQLFCR